MDTAQWPQEMGLTKSSMEALLAPSGCTMPRPPLMDRRPRPPREHALNCPRCQSTNTKFCYYNNYSLSQPRYFCKTCRRYWTEGGSLRNVPVGGGSRKNKRSSSSSSASSSIPSSSSSSAPSKRPSDPIPPPSRFLHGQDLNLTFQQTHLANPNPLPVDLLRGSKGMGMSPFLPLVMGQDGAAGFSSGFGLQELRSSSVNFNVDGIHGDGGYGSMQDGSGRVFFPFEDLRRHVSSGNGDGDQGREGGDPSVFWNGVIGGGGGASW